MARRPVLMKRAPHHRRKRRAPGEPIIASGAFAGKHPSELSDDELALFLKFGALNQTGTAFNFLTTPVQGVEYRDLTQYWCARFELERRAPKGERDKSAALQFLPSDSDQRIATKVFNHGFRVAAHRYPPDKEGGSNEMMRRLIDRKSTRLNSSH